MEGEVYSVEAAADRAKWEARYSAPDYVPGTEPARFLEERLGQLPRGRALGLAAGTGRNEIFLAQQGYEVTAMDISPTGLRRCRELAGARGVEVATVEADLRVYDLGQGQWDLITDFYYYEPALLPRIMPALRPGGMFVMQTFSSDQQSRDWKPRNPAFLIPPNALLEVFRGYRVRYYEDGIVLGGYHWPEEAAVRLIVENTPVGESVSR